MKAKKVIFSFIILFLIILLIPLILPMYFPVVNQVFLDVTPRGVIHIAGAAPQVLNIYMNETPGADQLCTNDPAELPEWYCNIQNNNDPDTVCDVDPVTIKVEVFDENGNCEQMDDPGSGDIIAYICIPDLTEPPQYCDEHNWDFRLTEDLWRRDSDLGLTCNLTADLDWSFYERWGNWSINITVYDVDDNAMTNTSNATFYREKFQSFVYPPYDPSSTPCASDNTVDLGQVTLGSYNNGTGCDPAFMTYGCWLKNIGNIRLNITWNASFFNNTADPLTYWIDVRYGNFSIDKDATHTDGAEVYMSDDLVTQVEFPTDAGRVQRCGGTTGVACDDDEDGSTNEAKFDVYWHINVPPGLIGGDYENDIWANSHVHEDGW